MFVQERRIFRSRRASKERGIPILFSPSIAAFFRRQTIYLSVAAISVAVFWSIGQQINPATVIVYAICIGNLTSPLMKYARRACNARSFPYDWLTLIAALMVGTPVVYVASTVAVFLIAPPSPQSLPHLLMTGWKFPTLVIVVYSVMAQLYRQTKERLERRNIELQHSVELGAARIEKQERELEQALEIQQSLLPKEIPQLPGFDIAACWRPARTVGGDYYDVVRLGKDRVAICIADVAGKGISAALLMANVQAVVRAFARDSESPARVCDRVNSVLCGNIATGKFVTFFYAVLDAGTEELQYCNAGHPPPLLVSGNSFQPLRADGAVLGVFPAWKYIDATIGLHRGDKLILYTDGIIEAETADEQEFGEERLAAAATASGASSASDLNSEILERVSKFCGDQFADDVTLMVIAAN